MNPKVSVVVPCYNGGKFIDNFMKAVLALEYDNIQLIITDDGSSDDSYQKLKAYEDLLKGKKIEFILLHKENGGQPSAFNYGVSRADGKYIVWPDIDDRMHPDFISKKVKYMEMNPTVDFLLSRSAIVPLNERNKILGYTWPTPITDNGKLVDRILKDYDCWFEPGAYLMRADSFDRLIPGRHIYEECGSWSGPQIQIVLPFFYGGKIGYINDCLYDYYIHENQHHNKLKDAQRLKRKCFEVKKVLVQTVKSLNASEEEEMMRLIEERSIRSETINAFQLNDKEWFYEAYSQFENNMLRKKDMARYLIMSNSFIYAMYKLYKRIKGISNPLA